MPTSTDLAQALALRKADPTLTTADAVAQVRSSAVPAPVTPAPVTPVAPMPVAPVTPIAPIGPPAPVAPPPNVNQAQHDANVASRQAQIQAGTIPAVGVNTPAPVAQKADPTPGINPTTSAQANAESEKIKAQNDAQIALETHKSNLTQQSQKQATQQANNALASDEGAILNTMRTGGIVPEAVKSSPYYQTAQQTYNKLQQYANYSTGDMVTAMNQGAILPGTTVYNEMMKDPVMKQKIIDAQVYKNANPAPVQEVYANSANDIVANNPTTASYLADGVITFDEYNKATNNPAVVTKIHDVEVKTNKYNTLKAEYDAIETDTKAEYQNKGGSGAYIDSIIADRQKSKYKNLQLASGEVDTANGTLTQLKSQASNLFETNLKLYEMQRTEQNQIKSEQRQVQSQKDMMQYKSDFEKKQAEIALNDPKTQIQATMDEFEKMGIVSQGNTASKIAEFKTSGKTLPEYISGLRAQFMSKPEYKKAMELKSGALSDSQKLFATQNFEIQKIKLES